MDDDKRAFVKFYDCFKFLSLKIKRLKKTKNILGKTKKTSHIKIR